MNFTLSTPAKNVKGSPTNGTQENIKVHIPNLLNQLEAKANALALIGNQRLFVNCEEKKPKTQFTTDPKILPKDANIRRSKISEWPAIAIFSNNISEAVGNNVAETKEAAKILK